MEESLSNEYWKKRCELAEKVIKSGRYDVMRMTDEDLVNFGKWGDFIKSPTDTALYTVFTDLLKENGMYYEFYQSHSDQPHELRFGKYGTNLKQTGTVIQSMGSIYNIFQKGLQYLKEDTLNTKS